MGTYPMVNHVEMTYPLGQRDAAGAFFEAMGFETFTVPGGPWLGAKVNLDGPLTSDNVMYANEPTPAQQRFDAALAKALEADAELAESLERYRQIRRKHPQYVFHFGVSVPTQDDWRARVDRLRQANLDHPLLRGRIEIDAFDPEPGDIGYPASQAFIHTDVLSAGPDAIHPLLFDLQWLPTFEIDQMDPNAFPDMATMT